MVGQENSQRESKHRPERKAFGVQKRNAGAMCEKSAMSDSPGRSHELKTRVTLHSIGSAVPQLLLQLFNRLADPFQVRVDRQRLLVAFQRISQSPGMAMGMS